MPGPCPSPYGRRPSIRCWLQARYYWKSHDFKELNVDVEHILCDAIAKLPSDECEAFVAHMGAATNRVAASDTAYPHRDVEFVVNLHTRWRRTPPAASM